MRIKLVNSYIAKNFLIRFLQISGGFSLLIFFINFLDALDKIKAANSPLSAAIAMAFFQIPDFLNDVAPSLVLIAAISSFFLLSSKSEITVIRMSGFSLWQILQPIAISAFVLGLIWTLIFDPISIHMRKKFNALESQYVKNEMREVLELKHGIWLKQSNPENPSAEIIIQAKKVYQENLELDETTMWFFDEDGQFYKKIDAEKMLLRSDSWLLEKVVLNDKKVLNKKLDSITVPTNLEPDFVMQKVVNNFQNVKLFSFFELPKLIKDLHEAGFSSTKFKVYFQTLLSRPLLFLAMTLIACYFGLNHVRNNNTILMIFFGIIIGLGFYITTGIISALGSSGLIPVFASTWVIAIICLAIGTLLIYRKEHI